MTSIPHPKRLIVLILVGIVLGVLLMQLLGWLMFSEGLVTIALRGPNPAAPTTSATATPAAAIKPIDRTRPLAAMIDNLPAALPQSGIDQAAVIFEAPVEGALTRLLAVFRGDDVPEIGPIRSSRPYFLDWAAGLDAVYAHIGGSDEALADLKAKTDGLDDADGMTNGAAFWRDNSRLAPHNAYTSTAKLRALIVHKGWRPETSRPDLSERGVAKPDGAAATTVKIRHSAGGELTTWIWDEKSGNYLRSVSGQATQTRVGVRVGAPTVVTLELKQKPIADPEGKGLIGIETIGQGPATVYRAGVKIPGQWSKPAATSTLTVKDANGQPIPLSDGLVWYEVILTNHGGTITDSAPTN